MIVYFFVFWGDESDVIKEFSVYIWDVNIFDGIEWDKNFLILICILNRFSIIEFMVVGMSLMWFSWFVFFCIC